MRTARITAHTNAQKDSYEKTNASPPCFGSHFARFMDLGLQQTRPS